jgi:SAM-dependent methyltransferase
MLLGYALIAGHAGTPGRVVAASRSFYGAISVVEHGEGREGPDYVMLRHGGITHGIQFADAGRRDEPTTYYGRHSGAGLALQRFRASAPRRIGAVGLGAGTLATYGRAGDVMRFYELNPDVLAYAQSHFTFLKDSAARVEHVLGDARLSLEREADQGFDVLVLDAFNGDAIPVHLLTREAFDVYRRHLKPGGLIAVHITNQHLDLRPIVEAAAAYLRLDWLYVPNEHAKAIGSPFYTSEWVLIGGDAAFLKSLPVVPMAEPWPRLAPRLWTDDDTSLFPILR